jgi:hypothetical protein
LFTPVALSPVPLIPAAEIVRLEFPPLVNVTCCVSDSFTLTLPKDRLVGFTLSVLELLVPAPVKTIVSWLSEALDAIPTDPLKLAADVGKNPTVNCVLPPAASDMGVLKPETENPVPFAAMLLIERLCPPVFFS